MAGYRVSFTSSVVLPATRPDQTLYTRICWTVKNVIVEAWELPLLWLCHLSRTLPPCTSTLKMETHTSVTLLSTWRTPQKISPCLRPVPTCQPTCQTQAFWYAQAIATTSYKWPVPVVTFFVMKHASTSVLYLTTLPLPALHSVCSKRTNVCSVGGIKPETLLKKTIPVPLCPQ